MQQTGEAVMVDKVTADEGDASRMELVRSIPGLLQKLELDVTGSVNEIPEKTGVAKDEDFSHWIRQNRLSVITPRRYIEIECIPRFVSVNQALKQELTETLRNVVVLFTDHEQLIDFHLDAAISLLDRENGGAEKAVELLTDGLNRSLKMSSRINEILNSLEQGVLARIRENSNLLLEDLAKLDVTENLLNKGARLLRSKALRESERRSKALTGWFFASTAAVVENSRKAWQKIQEKYAFLLRKLKLEKSEAQVSSEIYLPISSDIGTVKQMAIEAAQVSRHIYLNKPVTVLFSQVIADRKLMLQVKVKAYV
jgi:hypothetical protein